MFKIISATVLGILLLSIIPKYYCDDDTDELREALIKTKDKLSDLEDRFESCKDELMDYQSLDGKRDTDYERLLQHWTNCVKSLEEYKRREIAAEEEMEKFKADSKAAKELFLERESELSQRIKTLEADGTICEVDESVVEEKYEKEIQNLKRSKENTEENSAELFNRLQELMQAHGKLNDMYKEEEDRAFDFQQENEKIKERYTQLEWKYKDCETAHSNVRDCTNELNKANHELEKKEERMEQCAKSNNNCLKSRSNLQLDKKRWEHQQEDYEKQVNDLKEQVKDLTEQLEKAKNEAAQARAESSGGIRIDKNQQDIVKKIADELLACKIRTDTLQTDKSKLEADFDTLRQRLEEAKKKFGEVKMDETMKAEITKVTNELQSCKSEFEKLQEESGKFETEYKRKTREMRDQLGNELVLYKMNMSKLRVEKENLELDKDSLYDQIKKCESQIADAEESKEKLQMDKDSLYGQIKDCKTLKAKYQDYETIIAQLQKKVTVAETGLQNCETRMKTKQEEDIVVVKALMEKKAKEMEGTITEINQANKETQMKLNSCEFSLQIKEHELDSAKAFSKSTSEKLEECEGRKKDSQEDGDETKPTPILTAPSAKRPEKPKPSFYQSKSPAELCEIKLSETIEELGKVKVAKEEGDEELLVCRGVAKECEPEREQLKMMNAGLRMVLDQTEPKYKSEIADLKNEVKGCQMQLGITTNDADKYMRSFGVSVSILTAIAVTYGVKYGMKKYDERLENARLEKKKEKEERKQKKTGRKH